jgi:hypothetical protein
VTYGEALIEGLTILDCPIASRRCQALKALTLPPPEGERLTRESGR